MSVLLLNSTFEPLNVITTRRAIGLIIADKVDIIADGLKVVHSASNNFSIPSVIRMKYHVKRPYTTGILFSKKSLFKRDNRTCQYCFLPGTTVDHIVPRSRGGLDTWTNVVLACKKCNSLKANKTLEELGWKLLNKPFTPRDKVHLITAHIASSSSWAPYLKVYNK